ncbi:MULTISPECIES: hypothetical protein [unclassified Microbacterium]|uniref:hypothetical protein n=1 Tax=unclassified Microbacterium TaxID=2609290 RepID=UPI0012F9B65D|nr:hypothetical protein [Microbacterium sp. MAH-37]MVQ43878.1 hypothetical protein [Microbacterium sp. MAH-37]
MHRRRTPDRRWAAFLGGALAANSAPHLVTAARRRRMLTPLAGPDSGPAANLGWGAINLAAASALVAFAGRAQRRMLLPFTLGCAAFAAWALLYEKVIAPRAAASRASDVSS